MKARRVLEDVVVPAVIVAPYPSTVTQRTCLEWFGITKRDYLRLVAKGAFAVKVEGQLRVARFADVEAYLTDDAGPPKGSGPKGPAKVKRDPVAELDGKALLHRVGFR